jgi:RNA polymerase sigma factor (sigma-70 family)
VNERDVLAQRFDAERGRLRAVAYRMLGSLADAEDAVQEAWVRLARTDAAAIDNLGGWLTTVVGRVSLDMLRSRAARREDSVGASLPDPVVSYGDEPDPETEALLADSVGLALLVVLDTLTPAERLAFVLHDMFGVPFDEIAGTLGRSTDAAKMLASRARRRVRGAAPADRDHVDAGRQRAVVDAFLAAARGGDFAALVAVLDPDVVLRADGGAARGRPTVMLRGARAVAENSSAARKLARYVRPALVNGAAGAVVTINGQPFAVMGFTVADDRVVAIDILYDPDRLAGLDLTLPDG